MTKISSPNSPDQNLQIDSAPLRRIRERLFAASERIDIEGSPDSVSKLTVLMINLTKTIRETDTHNRKLAEDEPSAGFDGPSGGTLEERLEGYVPTPEELKKLRADLKERLQVIGPRLFDDDGP